MKQVIWIYLVGLTLITGCKGDAKVAGSKSEDAGRDSAQGGTGSPSLDAREPSNRPAAAGELASGAQAGTAAGARALAADGGARASAAGDSAPPAAALDENAVEIRRTSFGVPHVRAANEAGLGFGAGYAYAEDNLCLLAEAVVTCNGERSKHFGPIGIYDADRTGHPQTNLVSDFFYKYVNEQSLVQASWERQPADVRALVEGYAAGYNRYLRDTPAANRPAACRDAAWLREITPLDLTRFMRRIALHASGAQFAPAFYAATPPGAAPPSTAALRGSASLLPALKSPPREAVLGSNGAAFGRDATASGKGLLLSNPHFPWSTEFRLYQLHLTIPGKVDVMGSTLGGAPLIGLGWNAHVAWTHTFDTARHFTLFALELDPSDPTAYLVDGERRAMTKQTLTVDLPDGNVTHDYYVSEYGPVLVQAGGLEWTRERAVALRDANLGNDRLFEQWWAMNRATSLDALQKEVETVLGVPWLNVIAADAAGDVYYADMTPVPNVSDEKQSRCVLPRYWLFATQGLVVLDGAKASCNWDVDPTQPRQGLMPASKLPGLRRSDYVQNSNDSAWLTNAESPLVGFPSIVSSDSLPLSGRTRYSIQQIQERLAGRDGLPGNRFDSSSLQRQAFSNRSLHAANLLKDLQSICDGGNAVLDDLSVRDITKACQVLAGWDGTGELASIGYPLFHFWRRAMDASGVDYWSVPFDPKDPVNTPRGLRVADSAVVFMARRSLGQALVNLEARGMDYSKAWGELQVAVRGKMRIPIHGGASDDMYNVVISEPIGDGQFDAYFGSSAIWTVSFEGDSPKVSGFLTYSQSVDAASAHYADQTARFSEKAWISFPFSEAEIAADPALSVKQLRR